MEKTKVKLSICGNDYYITTDLPRVYMHQVVLSDGGVATWDVPFGSLEEELEPGEVFAIMIPDQYGKYKVPANYYNKKYVKDVWGQERNIEDIEILVAKPLEENSFMMVDAIINNDLNSLLTIYNDLKLQNEEPTRILAMLSNQLSLQYQVASLASNGHDERSIASMLNIHPYRTKLMIQKMRKIN